MWRPACRIIQTGTRSTFSPRAALSSSGAGVGASECVDGLFFAAARSLKAERSPTLGTLRCGCFIDDKAVINGRANGKNNRKISTRYCILLTGLIVMSTECKYFPVKK